MYGTFYGIRLGILYGTLYGMLYGIVYGALCALKSVYSKLADGQAATGARP